MTRDDLARAVVGLPGWRWMPGMLGIDDATGGRARVLVVDETGIPVEWAFQESPARQREGAPVLWQRVTAYGTPGWEYETWATVTPDLDDPATGGAVIDMLRAVWVTDPDHWLAVCLDVGDDGLPVTVECFGPRRARQGNPPFHTGVGPTIAHAAAAALVAIGRAG